MPQFLDRPLDHPVHLRGVADVGLKVQLLSQAMGDLSALADMKATKEDICNSFHVPLAFLSSETNLANLQAAEHQHMAKAIFPRLQRRDEKLNEQLLSLYDPSGRLFVYDAWANREVLRALQSGSPPPQAVRWLAHIIAAQWLWMARMQQHFRPTATDSYDVLTENRYFVAGREVEWEEFSFSVNGAKWGADRPAFPILQPEKVLSLPLQLRFDEGYTYRLDFFHAERHSTESGFQIETSICDKLNN